MAAISPFREEAEAAPAPAQADAVDAFLDSRWQLYKVRLAGLRVHVDWPAGQEWIARYTRRAIQEGAALAALRTLYGASLSAATLHAAWVAHVGHDLSYHESDDPAAQESEIDDPAMVTLAKACGLSPEAMAEPWRTQRGQARLIYVALNNAYFAMGSLTPYFDAKKLASEHMTVELVRHMIDKWWPSMIAVAMHHPAAAPWRAAYDHDAALRAGQREPEFADLPKATPTEWADRILALAAATRIAVNADLERQRADARRRALNEYLSPHELHVADPAAFILETFDSTPRNLGDYGWSGPVAGGDSVADVKGRELMVLRVDDAKVIFQRLDNGRFYEQTLQGFAQELVYAVYAEAGRKSLGAIKLTQWVIGLLGAVFPPVRYGIIATDVLNAAVKLDANKAELERDWEAVKVAYANIDKLLPGALPKIWDAVLDKRTLLLFNPLAHPDVAAWIKVVIRLVMERQARVAKASYVADAVDGFLQKGWAAIKTGLGALVEVVKHVIILGPAVAGSTGIADDRALSVAVDRLKALGVVEAAAIALQVRALSAADRDRLVREIEDLVANAARLMDVLKRSLSW